MHKKYNRIKRVSAFLALLLCTCSILSGSDMRVAYAASTGGQTSSSDILNVDLAARTGQEAVWQGTVEGAYTATDKSTGKIALDNPTVGGLNQMHVNIGQIIDMYAPSVDVDYTDKIGFSGNYTFLATGGRGGSISATDKNVTGTKYASGGYGSTITNNEIDYNTGQSIIYRKGSNGESVSVKNGDSGITNIGWDRNSSGSLLEQIMTAKYNGLLHGEHGNEVL